MAELAPNELIASLRKPKQIFTQAYLDDPIQFQVDERFQPETVLRQMNEFSVVERDNANFAVVDSGVTGSSYYPVLMNSPVFNRTVFTKNIDRNFRQLV